MKINNLLDQLFPLGHKCEITDRIVIGFAETQAGKVSIIGTVDGAELACDMILDITDHLLLTLRDFPGTPIIILVDTKGHKAGRKQEILGLSKYLAHLLKSLQTARINGHHLVTIVYGSGWAGGFLSLGLHADQVYGLESAEIGEMTLEAMSRVIKIPVETLAELSADSPIFAPGGENFKVLGGINEIWNCDKLDEKLLEALKVSERKDIRAQLAYEHQSRMLAKTVTEQVINAEIGYS